MNQSESIVNVVGKIMQVSREIGGIQKKQMDAGGANKQKYFAVEDVMAAVSGAMDKAGLWIIPACTGVEASEVALIYHFSFMIVDSTSGEYMERLFSQSSGAGTYQWTEAAKTFTFKAAKEQTSGIIDSYAYKNFVLKLFGISTPDADTEESKRLERESQRQNQQERRSITNPPKPAPVVPAMDDTAHDSAAAFDAIPSAFPDTAPIVTSQHKALMATLSDMKTTDDERHALIKLFTQERTTSSKDLTIAEFTRLMKLLKVWRAGLLAGEEKWNANHVLFAEKVSENTVHDFFLLNDAQIILVHEKVLKWLHAGKVTIPAKFNQL